MIDCGEQQETAGVRTGVSDQSPGHETGDMMVLDQHQYQSNNGSTHH